jgi:hypothetical protein
MGGIALTIKYDEDARHAGFPTVIENWTGNFESSAF